MDQESNSVNKGAQGISQEDALCGIAPSSEGNLVMRCDEAELSVAASEDTSSFIAEAGTALPTGRVRSWMLIRKAQIIQLAVFIVVALFSIFILGSIFSDPGTYTGLISTLDEKKSNVMALMTTTTAASAAISLIPNDVGAPIAEKLVDLSSYFMVILAVIYLEKFLIAIFGTLTFQLLIPVALAFIAIANFRQEGSVARANLQKIGIKLGAFGLALFLVVPTSVWISNTIDETFEASLQATNASMQESTEQIEETIQEAEVETEEKGFFESIADTVAGGFNAVTGAVQGTLDGFANQLNQMIDTLAVMIVTSCLIPILVLAFFLWIIKMLTGLNFGTTSGIMNAASKKGRSFASGIKQSITKD